MRTTIRITSPEGATGQVVYEWSEDSPFAAESVEYEGALGPFIQQMLENRTAGPRVHAPDGTIGPAPDNPPWALVILEDAGADGDFFAVEVEGDALDFDDDPVAHAAAMAESMGVEEVPDDVVF